MTAEEVELMRKRQLLEDEEAAGPYTISVVSRLSPAACRLSPFVPACPRTHRSHPPHLITQRWFPFKVKFAKVS